MNPKNTRTTIKQVVAAAGVSAMTVSRVLNERPDVSIETRQRIKRIIEELDYQPSALARSLTLFFAHHSRVVNLVGGLLLMGIAIYDLANNWDLLQLFIN